MSIGMPRAGLRASVLAAAAVAFPTFVSLAQQVPPSGRPAAQAPAAARPAAPALKDRDAAPPGDAGLQRRVEQLEEQLVDLQVVIGTLESLAKGGAAPAPGAQLSGAALSAADAGRLDA